MSGCFPVFFPTGRTRSPGREHAGNVKGSDGSAARVPIRLPVGAEGAFAAELLPTNDQQPGSRFNGADLD